MSGEPVAGINHYFGWPPYRPGYDVTFRGADAWNASRRLGSAESEAWLARSDFAERDAEMVREVEAFIGQLGGK
eukprot:2607153-Prymnesium_polylepis.1